MKFLVLATLVAHLAAVSAPCPGEKRAEEAVGDHHTAWSQSHHAMAVSRHEMPGHHAQDHDDGQTASLRAPCPCGCGGHSGAAPGPSERVGNALLPALSAESPNPFRSQAESPMTGVLLAGANSLDHIPILFQSA